MDDRLKQLENNQMDVMMRLQNLLMEVEALRNKTEQNRQMAKDAKAQADNATQLASSLEKVSVCPQTCVVIFFFAFFIPSKLKSNQQ